MAGAGVPDKLRQAMTETYAYSPETIIKAYSLGVFPMAESRDDPEINFYEPEIRGVLRLTPPHIPRRLLRLVRQKPYRITLDTDFKSVIEACAAPSDTRDDSWINPEIVTLYCALHKMGFAHSVEVWDGDALIGGLYGVRLGRAFFGESMFSRRSNASKIALTHLIARLYYAGYTLLDAQFSNDHLMQFGLEEIPKEIFKARLAEALSAPVAFPSDISEDVALAYLAQVRTDTS